MISIIQGKKRTVKHNHSILGTYPSTNIMRYTDEISLNRVYKRKKKYNTVQKKEEVNEKVEILINDDLKKYVSQILKNKPLRECYQ